MLNVILMPICKLCNIEKPLDDFYIRDKIKQIPTTYCKQCNKHKVKTWLKTEIGKKNWKEYDRKRSYNNKEWLNEQRSFGCQKCGEKRHYLIDFHHIDPTDKIFTVGATNRWTITQLKKEIVKCCRLCANCHREYHYKERVNNLNLKDYLRQDN